MEKQLAIKIENLKKQYRLGAIGGGTLTADLQSWWARIWGKEDPNLQIGMKGTKIGERFYALEDINLEIKKGEALGIIGTNGAGKSTLLKILSRVTAPTEGDVWINGRISSMLEVGTGFHPELTGRENIYMNGAILGMSRQEVDQKIEAIIDFSECRQFIDTPVKRYSSGMYVKLAFAVAAHLDADIIVMDEVLAVGDVKFQEKCLGKMGDAAENEGKTVLYVSHNMNTIRQLCKRCVVLNKGKIIFDGDTERAIEIYMDRGSKENKIFYDLSQCKRPSLDHGRRFFMESLEYTRKNEAVFTSEEKVVFQIKYNSEDYLTGLQLLVTVKAQNGVTIGMSQSEPFDVLKGKHEIEFQFDISNMVAGKYYYSIDVVQINEFGAHVSYEFPLENFSFVIEEAGKQDGIMWNPRFWGNVKLNSISVIE